MKRAPFYYKCIAAIVSIFFLSGCLRNHDASPRQPKAIQGILDLSEWNFAHNGTVKLMGEWEFYWEELLKPAQLLTDGRPDDVRYIDLPSSWNGYRLGDGKLSGNGYATFRLLISLSGSERNLAIRIPSLSTSYKLWVDGKPLSTVGKVGTRREESRPQYLPKVVPVQLGKETLEIVIQVSNFHHRRGGMWTSLKMGLEEQMIAKQNNAIAAQLFLCGGLVIMGFYHLGLFILRPRDKSNRPAVYFGLFCLIAVTRSLLVGETFIYHIFPDASWEIVLKIEYLAFYLGLPIALRYIYHLFPRDISKLVVSVSTGLGLAFAALVVATPSYVFTHTIVLYQLITLLTSVYAIYVLIIASIRKRKGTLLVAIGVIAYVAAAINDILYYDELAGTGDLFPFGLFICVMFQSFILSAKFSGAFQSIAEMSLQLRGLNSNLEEKITERTLALEQSNHHLEMMNRDLDRMEKSRRHLLINIFHDLGTPITLIQGYIEALLDEVVQNPGDQRKYLKLIHTRVLGLNRLIQDLFQLSRLEERQISFNMRRVPVGEFIRYFSSLYELEITDAGFRFERIVPVNLQELDSMFVRVDFGRLDQVFTNLIYNTFKHTKGKGIIRLEFSADESDLWVKVVDNGDGIDEEDLPYIFDRFYMKDQSRNSASEGSGLGLAIAKEIVESHKGRIGVESSVPAGSTFYFTLPLVIEDIEGIEDT